MSPRARVRATGPGHAHTLGYLTAGRAPRCGCGPDVLTEPADSGPAGIRDVVWVPFRRQHVGYVRAHFIYSDRMLSASRDA